MATSMKKCPLSFVVQWIKEAELDAILRTFPEESEYDDDEEGGETDDDDDYRDDEEGGDRDYGLINALHLERRGPTRTNDANFGRSRYQAMDTFDPTDLVDWKNLVSAIGKPERPELLAVLE